MLIRLAEQSDLEPAAKVCARAFFDTELFGEVIHPYRHEYPDDMYLYWLKNFRRSLGRKDHHVLVVTMPDESNAPEQKIIGVATWMRMRAHQDQDPATAQKDQTTATEDLPPNRAADPTKLDILSRTAPFFEHRWSGMSDPPVPGAKHSHRP